MTVRVHGTPAELRSEKARRLLALLAWQPNEFVADDFLIDRIWDEDLPVRPRDALYTCASRLRHALGDGTRRTPVGPLYRRRGGYLLGIDPQTVDLHQFRGLVRSARNALRLGDGTRAMERFDESLALWGGTPMSDLESSWSARVRVGLARELMSAQVDRAQLALRLGRHRETVPALYQLAEEYPLDETIAQLLIEALYRSGRQGESLACFAGIRNRLVLELGDEPGAALHDLHGRILRRDPSLHLTAS
ncbi:BTAD domain-containing putative transcriptional regulator [Streptomyces sp. NPDC059569]|uniref:AfsR/SARP family transcriptional regulator n=1 Tax=unclassified Streptomyces TaxID=2593676 RepID=UPI0036CAA373